MISRLMHEYELALHDENEEIKHHAADSLFGFLFT